MYNKAKPFNKLLIVEYSMHPTNQTLRLITLEHQGLVKANHFGKGIEATQQALEQLGYIQIDTLSVVSRAHHHTLRTRISDYQPSYLNQLVARGSAFEYWFHAASYLPIQHYRFCLPQMSAIQRGESPHYTKVYTKDLRYVLDRIRIDGPCKARDFETPTRSKTQWWSRKPAKRALEQLFMQGDLMIRARDGMEKLYDLRERVLPSTVSTSEPSLVEFAEYLINHAVQAYGVATLAQLTHLRTGKALRQALSNALAHKIEAGELVECKLEAMPPIYTTPKILTAKIRKPTANIRLLSPFDNAIIHRERVQQLFGFHYRLECYTPKTARQFGYFCLPILYNDSLVGRVDCKAHRNTKELELITLYIESNTINIDEFMPCFAKAVHRFALFNDCNSIQLTEVHPKTLRKLCNSQFSTS